MAIQDDGKGDPEAADAKNNDPPHGEPDIDDFDGDPVDMRDGSFGYSKRVFHLPGRGLDVDMTLSYRSGAHGIPTRTAGRWTHPYEQKVVVTIGNFPTNQGEYEGPISTTGAAGPGESGGTGGDGAQSPDWGPGGAYQMFAFYHHDLRIDRYHADSGPPVIGSPFIAEHAAPAELKGYFITPIGIEVPESVRIRKSDGQVFVFGAMKPHEPDERAQFTYRLSSIHDRNGNTLTFDYEEYILPNPTGLDDHCIRIKTITDTLGRVTTLNYDAYNWLETIVGPHGRTATLFREDGRSNLTAIEVPGNNGVKSRTEFTYTEIIPGEEGTGQSIVSIVGPNETADGTNVPYIRNEWSDSQYQVMRQYFGGMNYSGVPAGGFYDFFYEFHGNPLDQLWFQEGSRVLRIDPSGNVKLNIYDRRRQLRLLYRFTGRRAHTADRASMPSMDSFVTVVPDVWPPVPGTNFMTSNSPSADSYEPGSEIFIQRQDYDEIGRVTRDIGPDWTTVSVFDPTTDIFQRNNLLITTKASNSDLSDVQVTAYMYEPVFNQVRQVIDARGTGLYAPTNGGNASELRYGQQYIYDYQEGSMINARSHFGWGVDFSQQSAINTLASYGITASPFAFDLGDDGGNGDGSITQRRGNCIKTVRSATGWDDILTGTYIDRDSTTLTRFNDFGQAIEIVAADGTVREAKYFPDSDPSGLNGALPGSSGGGWIGEQIEASRLDNVAGPLPERASTRYEYDERGRNTATVNARGFRREMSWNAQDRMTHTIMADGGTTSWEYDEDGNTIEVRTSHKTPIMDRVTGEPVAGAMEAKPDIVMLYEHDILGNIVLSTDVVSDGRGTLVTKHRYDRSGNLVLSLFPEYNQDPTTFASTVFDEGARPWLSAESGVPSEFISLEANADIPELGSLLVAPPEMALTEHRYHGTRRVATINPSFQTATFEYDGFNRRTAMVDPTGTRTEYDHDVVSNLIAERMYDFRGILLSEELKTYDELNRVIQVDRLFQLPNGDDGAEGVLTPGDGYASARFQYDAFDKITASVGDNGDIHSTQYDRMRRPILETQPEGDATSYAYDSNSNPIYSEARRYDHDGTLLAPMRQWLFYDNMDRLAAATNELGHTHRTAYDTVGRVVFTSDARSSILNQALSSLDSFGEHSGLGAANVSINGHGNTTWTKWDDTHKVSRSLQLMRVGGLGGNAMLTGPDGVIATHNVYDRLGRIVGRVDNNRNLTSYTYNGKNQRTQTLFSDGTSNLWVYNSNGTLLRSTDANGTIVEYQYEALDRVKEKNITLAPGVEGVTKETFAFDGLGRTTFAKSFKNGALVNDVRRAYDTLSNLVIDRLNGKTTSHFYDGEAYLVDVRYPGGASWLRSYDGDGRLMDVTEAVNSTVVASYGWLSRSIRKRGHSNGTESLRSYDPLLRPEAIQHTYQGSLFESRSSTWDRGQNRIGRANLSLGTSFDYEYDSQERMVKSVSTDAQSSAVVLDYDLDGVGNRKVVTANGTPEVYVMDATQPVPADLQVNQYTMSPSENRTYDEVGNLMTLRPTIVGGRSADIYYDYRNLMVRYVDLIEGVEHRYQYDALGRRTHAFVGGTSGTTETKFYYTNGNLIAETRDGVEGITAIYLWGGKTDEAILQDRDDDGDGVFERFFMHTDDQANVNALTRQNGQLAESYEYADYGQAIDPSTLLPQANPSLVGNPMLYNGLPFDRETALVYSRARYLDPIVGRWTTRDPIGTWGDLLNLGNAYTFVGNNPWSNRDPMGMTKWSDIEGGTTSLGKYLTGAYATGAVFTVKYIWDGLEVATKWAKMTAASSAIITVGAVLTEHVGVVTGYHSRNPGLPNRVAQFIDLEVTGMLDSAMHEFTTITESNDIWKVGTDAEGQPNSITHRRDGATLNYIEEVPDGLGGSIKRYSMEANGDSVYAELHFDSEGMTTLNLHVTLEDGTTLQTMMEPDGTTRVTVGHVDTKGSHGYIYTDQKGQAEPKTMSDRQIAKHKEIADRYLSRKQREKENARATHPKLRRGDDNALTDTGDPLSSMTAKSCADHQKLRGNTKHHGSVSGTEAPKDE